MARIYLYTLATKIRKIANNYRYIIMCIELSKILANKLNN